NRQSAAGPATGTRSCAFFISHDLAIVEHMTHRVAGMYLGKIVELAPKERIFAAPKHPYTEALLSALPMPQPGAARRRIILKGDVPSPINPPRGCRFHTRCPYAFDRCRVEEPELRSMQDGRLVACHLHDLPAAQNPLAGSGPHRAQAVLGEAPILHRLRLVRRRWWA